MAAKNVKGITVEIGGDTTKLGKALESSEKQSRDLQKELKEVNTALKFNPNNVELLTQKQKLLTDQIQATKEKLDTLKAAESQVEAQFNAGKIGEDQFRAFQREIVETESKLKTYQSQLEATGKKASALDNLTNTIDDQEKAVEELKEEYKNAVLQYGKNSDEAKALAKQIDSLSGELKDNKAKMSDLDKAADDLDNSLEDVGKTTDTTSGGFTVMKGVLADLVSKGIQAAINGLKNLAKTALEAYQEFDEGQDNVIKATGATGKAAQELSDSYKKVSKQVVGDLGSIGSALGEVNTRFGWTGEKLESATTQFMKFSDITGVDAVHAVQLVSRAMEGAGIDSEEYATVLDQLAVAGQASGTSVEKLAENLTKFGTPMREMGLSTSESIAMLAQFEKAGVNTEVALGGMRKALTTWTKDGKVASKEFEKVVQQIKDAPNATKATEIAIENFGTKAGPELADAIKSGRFEWSEFIELIEGSAGAVTDTYEETQDGFDKIQLAMQGVRSELGDFVGKVLDKYQPQIESAIHSGVEFFKTAVKVVVENFDTIKTIAGIVIPILAAVFAVNKIANFIKSLDTLKGTVTGLFTTIQAHPMVAVASAAVALAAGIVAITKASNDAMEATYGLNDAEKELISKIQEETAAIKEAKDARTEANKKIEAEIGHSQNLWDELKNIVDENGKIKKGYEERAAVITGLLSKALGEEIKIVDGQIQKYDELKGKIEDVIRTKRAEALLEANRADYDAAVAKSSEAYATYRKQLEETNATREKLSKAEAEAKELRAVNDLYVEAQKKVATLTKKYEDQSSALSDAESNYFSYASMIENYEGVMAAMASGDVDALSQALDRLSNNFLTTGTATKEMLENQLNDFKEQYKYMKEAVDQGMPGVSKAQVEATGKLVQDAERELEKLSPSAKKQGEKSGKSHAEGLESTKGDNKTAGKKVAVDTVAGLESSDTEKSGAKKGNEYAAGVSSTEKAGLTAGKKVAGATDGGLGSADSEKTGKKVGEAYAKGVKDTSGSSKKAGETVSKSADSGAGSASLEKTGKKVGDTFVKGVNAEAKDAKAAGSKIASNADKGAGSVSAKNSGENFGAGYVNGIGNWFTRAFNKAKALAQSALSGLKKGQKEGSPSKLTYQSGEYFDLGYINAIQDKTKDAVKAAQEMAKKTVAALGEEDISDALTGDFAFNGATFNRQLETTFAGGSISTDLAAIMEKLDAVTAAIAQYSGNAIVLDTGVLVGETINKIDDGLAGVYGLKARGI